MNKHNPRSPVLRMREDNNPYLHGAALVWRQLKWDCKPVAWSSRRKMKKLRNTESGGKAVILCNGPSLNSVDFDLLDNVYTFGLNKINLLFSRTRFRPSCIVSVNHHVLEQNKEFFVTSKIPLFLDSGAYRLFGNKDHITYLNGTSRRKFARDCSVAVYSGHTVTFVAMQLAFHMGFEEVALVGCDHSFEHSGMANQSVVATGEDRNHFDPTYFSSGMTWELPDLFESEVAYNMAKEIYTLAGRTLCNATEGGFLEIFPRVELVDFIAS